MLPLSFKRRTNSTTIQRPLLKERGQKNQKTYASSHKNWPFLPSNSAVSRYSRSTAQAESIDLQGRERASLLSFKLLQQLHLSFHIPVSLPHPFAPQNVGNCAVSRYSRSTAQAESIDLQGRERASLLNFKLLQQLDLFFQISLSHCPTCLHWKCCNIWAVSRYSRSTKHAESMVQGRERASLLSFKLLQQLE